MTDIAIGVVDGKVVAKWHDPTDQIEFDPQNAFQIGEALSRAAHEARFGQPPQSDESYLADQIRARVTEQLRLRMVNRVVLILGSMERRHKSPGQIAMHLVDEMLKAVT